jgi:predicted MPP superfamily phosphohydrolase
MSGYNRGMNGVSITEIVEIITHYAEDLQADCEYADSKKGKERIAYLDGLIEKLNKYAVFGNKDTATYHVSVFKKEDALDHEGHVTVTNVANGYMWGPRGVRDWEYVSNDVDAAIICMCLEAMKVHRECAGEPVCAEWPHPTPTNTYIEVDATNIVGIDPMKIVNEIKEYFLTQWLGTWASFNTSE